MSEDKKVSELTTDDVEWVINDFGELGVKIGNKFFFLYKGQSYQCMDQYRPVMKREFGECCHSDEYYKLYIGASNYMRNTDGSDVSYRQWESKIKPWMDDYWVGSINTEEVTNTGEG